MRWSTYILLLSAIATGTYGCEDEPQPLQIWAAASLADVMPQVAQAWRRDGGSEVAFSFDASSRLARQIEAGAPADLFVSADAQWMDYLAERIRIVESTQTDLLGNRLVVVVPSGTESRMPRSPEALHAPTLRRIAVAAEEVPAGRYADAVLAHHGLAERLADRLVRASNVRGALAWVAAGEVDAGIVYRTDARTQSGVREAFDFSEAAHPPIVYPAAVIRHARHADLARRFLDFAQSETARSIFEEAGFEVR